MKRLAPFLVVLVLAAGCAGTQQVASRCPSGQSTVVFKALPGRDQPLTPAGMQLAARIVTSRLHGLGVASPKITVANDEITVRFTGDRDPTKDVSLVASTGQLQFFDFEKALVAPTVKNGNPTPYPTLYRLLERLKRQVKTDGASAFYLFGNRMGVPHVLAGPAPTRQALRAAYGGQASGTTILAVPANREVVSGPAETAATHPVGKSPNGVYWYLFALPSAISSGDLKESTITAMHDPTAGVPEVILGFTRHGARQFQAITRAEYERGQLVAGLHGATGILDPRYAQHNAIVLDNKLEAVPFIDYTDAALSLGIAGGQAVISNMGSMQAANNLALVLQTGSLPYTFERVSLRICPR